MKFVCSLPVSTRSHNRLVMSSGKPNDRMRNKNRTKTRKENYGYYYNENSFKNTKKKEEKRQRNRARARIETTYYLICVFFSSNNVFLMFRFEVPIFFF